MENTKFRFHLTNTLNANVLERIRASNNIRKPRELAFSTTELLSNPQQEDFANKLGKAMNLADQPQPFQALFDETGAVLPEARSKILFIEFLDRKEAELKKSLAEGTEVKEDNLANFFNEKNRQNMKKYYNTRKKTYALAKGSATRLLSQMLDPSTSPLYGMGVRYMVLHAASQALADNYYGPKFGFKKLLGVPQFEFELVGETETISYGGQEIQKQTVDYGGGAAATLYFRNIDGTDYLLYENDSAGPIMYVKLQPPARPRRRTRRRHAN
jgi:hypothetical protein